jgi:cell wall-associated NlpC family hydrolase
MAAPLATVQPVSRQAVVATARRYLGTPFRHQGRGDALDCVGLAFQVARDLGLEPEDRAAYGRQPHGLELKRELDARLRPIAKDQAQPGDVVLLAWRRLMPAHAAILGDGPDGALVLIHADGQVGRVVEHRLDREWWGRIVCAYRLAELA